eukprot:GHVU01012066.1.p1 GENE.GHVU01012066.1~~GHVU01012066.1.p1  ORF type:complete len:121 (-),score=2.55 GHVU01012066.1:86-448(-)
MDLLFDLRNFQDKLALLSHFSSGDLYTHGAHNACSRSEMITAVKTSEWYFKCCYYWDISATSLRLSSTSFFNRSSSLTVASISQLRCSNSCAQISHGTHKWAVLAEAPCAQLAEPAPARE